MRYVEILTLYHSSHSLSMIQLAQTLDKLTVKVEEPARKPVLTVRYQAEECFIGRDEIMLEIAKRFEQHEPRVEISGIGGVGYIACINPFEFVLTRLSGSRG